MKVFVSCVLISFWKDATFMHNWYFLLRVLQLLFNIWKNYVKKSFTGTFNYWLLSSYAENVPKHVIMEKVSVFSPGCWRSSNNKAVEVNSGKDSWVEDQKGEWTRTYQLVCYFVASGSLSIFMLVKFFPMEYINLSSVLIFRTAGIRSNYSKAVWIFGHITVCTSK